MENCPEGGGGSRRGCGRISRFSVDKGNILKTRSWNRFELLFEAQKMPLLLFFLSRIAKAPPLGLPTLIAVNEPGPNEEMLNAEGFFLPLACILDPLRNCAGADGRFSVGLVDNRGGGEWCW